MNETKRYASAKDIGRSVGQIGWACITAWAWLTVAYIVATYLGWPALLAGGVIAINYVRRGGEL